jgi:hypothetical protein
MSLTFKSRSHFYLSAIILMLLAIVSCNKKFDEPPGFVLPDITATMTIAELKAMHTTGSFEAISTNDVIEGIVIANDSSGNFYKEIIIQDASGGIDLLIEGFNLYTSFQTGRQVFVKLNGLYLGDYNNKIQLGGGVDSEGSINGISSTLLDEFVLKGSFNNTVAPIVVTTSQLNDSYQNMLVQLENFEFQSADLGKTYAISGSSPQSVNYTLKNCSGQSIVLRNSGYADFANLTVPAGNGTITAVYSVFGSTKQLFIRDTNDIQFYGERCSGGSGGVTEMNISDLRALYPGTGTTDAPENKKITGIVISDRNGNNLNGQNIVLQQGDGLSGIVVRFTSNHSFNLGDKLEVNVTGGSLGEFNGWLQVSNLSLSAATKTGTGTISPRIATTQQINDNFEAWESTLVQINNATISGGTSGTFKGTTTITDASGTVSSFTGNSATFANNPYPTGNVTFKGYVIQFNTAKQVNMRNATDVQ